MRYGPACHVHFFWVNVPCDLSFLGEQQGKLHRVQMFPMASYVVNGNHFEDLLR
jgi:hypothetical protein